MADEKGKEGKKGGMMIVIVAAVVAALIVGVGIGAYIMGTKQGAAKAAEEHKAEKPKEEEAPKGLGPLVKLEDFVVNLLDEQESRYLKASISLEMEKPEAVAEVEQRLPQVRDAILLLIGSKTFVELRDVQGKLQLRAELLAKVNELLKAGKVTQVYFTDFVIQ